MSAEQLAREPIPDCPYRGLAPFSEEDRRYFFGRETDAETIGANLITAPLTIFYGSSGVGKTSVLLAGVMPFVRKQADVTPLVVRKWQSEDFEQRIKETLAEAVKEKTGRVLSLDEPLDQCIALASEWTRTTIVMILDQFEEYMLYHPAGSPEGRSFDLAFARAVNRDSVDANFMISMREDSLASLDRFRHAIPDLLANRVRLQALDVEGAQRAIRMPLQRYNEVLAAHGRSERMEVEDALVDGLLSEVRVGGVSVGALGQGRIDAAARTMRVETPFLQKVLETLWEAERKKGSHVLRAATLRELGGAQKIVRNHVENVMSRVSGAEREAASRVFDRLVTPSGSKIAFSETDLAALAGNRHKAVAPLLRKLVDARILRTVEATGASPDSRYEIFHDVLSSAVLHWRARYVRGRELIKRVTRVAVPVVLVAGLAMFYMSRQRAQFQELADVQQKLNAARVASAESMSEAGAVAKRRDLLEKSLAIYTELGDEKGQYTARALIADADAAEGKYQEALQNYDKVLSLTTDDATRAGLLLRKGKAELAMGNREAAESSYRTAVLLSEARRDRPATAEALIAYASMRQTYDLEGSLPLWDRAVVVQREIGDVDGQSRSLDNIKKINAALVEKQQPRTIPRFVPPDVDGGTIVSIRDSRPVPRCTVDSMNGSWRGGDNSGGDDWWDFAVEQRRGGTSLSMTRDDKFVSGTLVFTGKAFVGALKYATGEERKVMIPLPTPENGCNSIKGREMSFTLENHGY